MEFENNAFFWQKLDTLFLSSDLIIDRPKGSTHPKYQNLVYPVDYGYLKEDSLKDHIGCYKGSIKTYTVSALILCADILKKDIEAKLLVGCTPEEEKTILEFVNQTDFQKTVIMRRGSDLPDWAIAN